MRPITPCYIKFGEAIVNPVYDVIKFWPLCVFMLSSLSTFSIKLHIMPTFRPNEYMMKTFADKVKNS